MAIELSHYSIKILLRYVLHVYCIICILGYTHLLDTLVVAWESLEILRKH